VAAAYAELESRRVEVNDLNVFPVADGDTGDNMAMTMRAVLDELDRMNGEPIDVIGREEIVHAVARASLLGARGNSGVILSQIVRGAAAELVSRPGELVDPVLVAAALARAADAAYASVRDPAEGTMLSAIRAMAHRVAQELAHMDTPRLNGNVAPEEQDELLAEVLERALEAGKEAVERGREQLPALRDADVVDAGAYGLTVIVAGVIGALRGQAPPELEHQEAPRRSLHLPQHESSKYRYCTNFAVSGSGLENQRFVPMLEEIGDSVLVVGDDETLKVHVHTDDPDRAIALFAAHGQVSRFDIADMREQVADRTARLGRRAGTDTCGVVAVANGAGMLQMFEGLGALVVDGGQTLNPSTYEILARIHDTDAEEVVVLPNSANVIMAAERAAELSEKRARVVPTRAQQAGLAALIAFDSRADAAANAVALEEELGRLRSGGIARAARDDARGRFREGDALGYIGDDLVAWGDVRETVAATFEIFCEDAEVLTCIAGEGAPLGEDEIAELVPGEIELEQHDGGQPAWWWLLCAE